MSHFFLGNQPRQGAQKHAHKAVLYSSTNANYNNAQAAMLTQTRATLRALQQRLPERCWLEEALK